MKKLFALLVALILACGCFAAMAEGTYPIETEDTLTMWIGVNIEHNDSYTNYNDWPFLQFLEEASGVHVQYLQPVSGADSEQAFNLLISSGELPDIIFMNDMAKRASSLLEEGYIIPLNDYLEYAPNLSAILAADPLEDKSVKTDKGEYYVFPFIREDLAKLGTFVGMSVNTKLLEEVGMDAPTTIDEWDAYLYAIKDLCDVPIGGNSLGRLKGCFANAFGFNGMDNYYIEDGVVKTWMNAEGYKDLLELVSRWMADGIIDPDIITINSATFYNKMAAQTYGACWKGSGAVQGYIKQVTERDGGFFWEAVPYPVANEGDEIKYIQGEASWTGNGAVITSSCKNVELAVKWLDFSYGNEGIMLWNYGKEGLSYEMVDGLPQYTAIITEANEALREATGRYVGINGTGWSVMQVYFDQIRNPAIATEFVKVWTKDTEAAVNYRMPAISATPEELAELSDIETALTTYANTMFTSFLIGSESLDNYDAYLANLEALNIDRVLEIKQAQYDRFMAR